MGLACSWPFWMLPPCRKGLPGPPYLFLPLLRVSSGSPIALRQQHPSAQGCGQDTQPCSAYTAMDAGTQAPAFDSNGKVCCCKPHPSRLLSWQDGLTSWLACLPGSPALPPSSGFLHNIQVSQCISVS